MPKLHPLALAAMAALAHAQTATPPRTAVAVEDRQLAIEVQAAAIEGRPDRELKAQGGVELRRGDLVIRTERLDYDHVRNRLRAQGQVEAQTARGDRFAGTLLDLDLDLFEGFLERPEYWFARSGAGGRAQRVDFLDRERSLITAADYTSCRRDGQGVPAWLLSSDSLRLDFAANEGIAKGAVLRFQGVPILAWPALSFPITGERKSGWLPPALNLDSKSGLELGVPWYWNIAPQRDATLTPVAYTKRGLGVEAEFRYLEATHGGEVQLHWIPHDRVAAEERRALQWRQSGTALGSGEDAVRWRHQGLRVSDDAYWKDFARGLRSFTPRLLPLAASVERDWNPLPGWSTTAYGRVQLWQVLQDPDPSVLIAAPYDRAPQIGWRGQGRPWTSGPDLGFELEFNRFVLTSHDAPGTRPEGQRGHLRLDLTQRWRTSWAWMAPHLGLNLASYRTDAPMPDGRTRASRSIPTFSLDGGLLFERPTRWFGRAVTQTLEPRVLYVNTPLRDQSALPLWDTAAKDFNVDSLFSENAFTGVDRVTDAHQVTAGLTTRWIDARSGIEWMRLGVAQRYLLRDQYVTPDGQPLTQRLSDLLVVGSARASARWTFDAAVQYGSQNDRVNRSVISARYSAGPFRVLSAHYRLTRNASEQLDLGWQWPMYRREAPARDGCGGTLYGVGRINYSMRDSRITDSLAGLEYDAGCWIGRVVAERVSTGRAAATTRLMLQLELVGLSRLGSNPLSVLKDNIPGYTLLRDERTDPPLRTYTLPTSSPGTPPR
ncbi:MAG TPA: LPS assembly protein LptD [Burkholderiaceae bacterium]|nr:LPS assembly protein LptD [Burkholderiaceae bacterium]